MANVSGTESWTSRTTLLPARRGNNPANTRKSGMLWTWTTSSSPLVSSTRHAAPRRRQEAKIGPRYTRECSSPGTSVLRARAPRRRPARTCACPRPFWSSGSEPRNRLRRQRFRLATNPRVDGVVGVRDHADEALPDPPEDLGHTQWRRRRSALADCSVDSGRRLTIAPSAVHGRRSEIVSARSPARVGRWIRSRPAGSRVEARMPRP